IVKVDGQERPEGSFTVTDSEVEKIPPYTSRTKSFMVSFVKEGFGQVSVSLEEEAVGLRADNTRYAFVEVKKQVPILVIDGEGAAGAKRGGGTFFLQTVFTAAKGYHIVPAGVEVLEKPNLLREYPCVFLLNVPELKEKALKNLEEFAKNGGGVAFFL